jgi:threonine/homoserine/homoserine lactone efflux protein
MFEPLPSSSLLLAFLIASFVLAVTPGPGVFFIVTRTVAQGRRAGLASVAGVAAGNLCNAIGAALGLAALFAISAAAFTIVKYAGAAYLIYLGIQALLTRPVAERGDMGSRETVARILRDGFIVASLNPKTALFFAAFLPQFIGPHASVAQTIVLGAMFVAIAAVTDTVYALAAGTFAPLLARNDSLQRAGHYFVGGAFIGLGLLTALTGSRNGKG